jgi:thiol-disulfide isomerase/thioredoxin
MRHASRISFLFSAVCLLGGLSLSHSQAVQGPMAPAAPPGFELNAKGKRDTINFGLMPQPISNPNLKLSQFQGRRLLLFYFSAKCPHCQHAYPYMQKVADELVSKGFNSLAVAIKYNSEEDIRGFIRDFGVRMPVMQDEDRTFGDRYGVGTIPTIYLINEKGEYVRYTSFNESVTPGQIRNVVASWGTAAGAKKKKS